jgi:hypothetical protein
MVDAGSLKHELLNWLKSIMAANVLRTVEDVAPTGIWSLHHPTHSELVYQLRYTAHSCIL